jgi:hypothetical protein
MLRILVSGQSCETARTLKEEPCRLNASIRIGKSQNRLSRSGKLQAGRKYLAGVRCDTPHDHVCIWKENYLEILTHVLWR